MSSSVLTLSLVYLILTRRVQAFILSTFNPSEFPRAVPSYLWYDNNCNLLRHLGTRSQVVQEYFRQTGFPVDVFHAVNKHKETDDYCNRNCNPAGFPDLYDEATNKWTFNSSAAEQANVWYGKFLPVVREMNKVHYNFFLDEMITIHNAFIENELQRGGSHPRLVPQAELRLPL